MFIAHLPAAYLLIRVLPVPAPRRVWVLTGAVLPDLDMLAFHLWDGGTVHHHSYLTHRPALWLLVLLLAALLPRARGGAALGALSTGALLHMALDSIAGQIAWGWPFLAQARPLVEVPATQDWWVLSFVLHWTFAVEILLCGLALLVWRRRRNCAAP